MAHRHGKTAKISVFSTLESMPDTVRIFEGFRRFQPYVSAALGLPEKGSVQYFRTHPLHRSVRLSGHRIQSPEPCGRNGGKNPFLHLQALTSGTPCNTDAPMQNRWDCARRKGTGLPGMKTFMFARYDTFLLFDGILSSGVAKKSIIPR